MVFAQRSVPHVHLADYPFFAIYLHRTTDSAASTFTWISFPRLAFAFVQLCDQTCFRSFSLPCLDPKYETYAKCSIDRFEAKKKSWSFLSFTAHFRLMEAFGTTDVGRLKAAAMSQFLSPQRAALFAPSAVSPDLSARSRARPAALVSE